MSLARILARIGIIALAAGLFSGMAAIYAGSIRPPAAPPFRVPVRVRRQRPPEPRLSAAPNFLGEGLLFALITTAGRKVLRLRLASR